MTDAAAVPTPDTDPIAIVFPGQGSQAPGMGKLVYQKSEAARRTFEEASDLTHLDVLRYKLNREKEALAASTTPQEIAIRTQWVRQLQNEVDEEYCHLGLFDEGETMFVDLDELLKQLED